MTSTALENPKVRTYLRELDAALVLLPSQQARELRDQITAHLDDALLPDAGDDEVVAVLDHLGSVREVVAAATGATRAPLRRRVWARLHRVRWWWWAAIAVVTMTGGTAIGLTISLETTSPLTFASGDTAWWDSYDSEHSVLSTADGLQQSTVPIRPGHEQGYLVQIYNPSGWSQTVVGAAEAPQYGAGGLDQISVSTSCPSFCGGVNLRALQYRAVVTIPPHQYRILRVLWTSPRSWICDGCVASQGAVTLAVRVGWVIRTEDVTLPYAFAVCRSSSGRCPTSGGP